MISVARLSDVFIICRVNRSAEQHNYTLAALAINVKTAVRLSIVPINVVTANAWELAWWTICTRLAISDRTSLRFINARSDT